MLAHRRVELHALLPMYTGYRWHRSQELLTSKDIVKYKHLVCGFDTEYIATSVVSIVKVCRERGLDKYVCTVGYSLNQNVVPRLMLHARDELTTSVVVDLLTWGAMCTARTCWKWKTGKGQSWIEGNWAMHWTANGPNLILVTIET